MKVTVFTMRPGVLIHLVALVAAAVGAYWAWSGRMTSAPNQNVISSTHPPFDEQGSAPIPECRNWTTGDIGKMIANHGLSVEALNMSSDEEEVVARVVSSYSHLYALTGKLMQTPGLSINSLSLKKSRHESRIEATIVLRIRRASTQ